MSSKLPIAFFDSGVGGLSVYSRFRKVLPNEDTIYFGDLKNLPYGSKTQDELISYAKNILKIFESKNVKAVVIACNTSSALAYEKIKNDYNFEIYPIIQSCTKVISSWNCNKIGVFATVGTVRSGAYKTEIQKHNNKIDVLEIACPNWVNIVEGLVEGIDVEQDIKSKLEEMLSFSPDKIILGCTHYPYLLTYLTKIFNNDIFVDPAEIFVDFIKSDLKEKELLSNAQKIGKEEFFVSATPNLFVENAKLFYEIKQLPIVID